MSIKLNVLDETITYDVALSFILLTQKSYLKPNYERKIDEIIPKSVMANR
jgi:hypothetical protein